MLCLPDGNILYGSQGDDQYYVYTPGSGPLASGKPSISSVIKINCDTFMITGRLFNGITEGAGYGDDWQMASNYPLVRLTSNDTVIYARTYNWNSTGVMRGLKADTAMFSLQDGLTVETYGLQVVANGNASNPVSFNLCSYLSAPNTLASNASVSVFPNPANGQVSVSFDSKTGGTYDIKLQDIYGRMVMDKKGIALAGSNTIELQLKGIKAGIYTLNLRESNTVYTTKLEVEE
jgi:hypothetical protein